MRVQFIQSGGLVGTVKGCVLDAESLPPGEAQELERLVRASGITASAESLSAGGRDLHQYEITIQDGKHVISATLDDKTLPAAAKPLVAFLKKHARPQALK
jgi:hypothetical protein